MPALVPLVGCEPIIKYVGHKIEKQKWQQQQPEKELNSFINFHFFLGFCSVLSLFNGIEGTQHVHNIHSSTNQPDEVKPLKPLIKFACWLSVFLLHVVCVSLLGTRKILNKIL